MGRSIKKGPYVDSKLFKKIEEMNSVNTKKAVKTWSRRSTIFPDMIGHTLMVHNGKIFIPVYVSENMFGHNLVEFSPSRTYRGHTSKDDKLAKKKR